MSIVIEAKSKIAEIDKQFQEMKPKGSLDELRFKENLSDILKQLDKSTKVDNQLLIGLETFYQHGSFLIGLSSLKLDEETKLAWREYDRFHFETIKPQLKLYGLTVGF